MKKRILLCISNDLGLKIYKLIKNHEVDIYSSNTNLNLKGVEVKNISLIHDKKKFEIKLSKSKKYDFIILVYWPWLVKKKFFSKFYSSINFHPSLLPYGRGWYPHVHSKIKNLPYGVTLHEIDHGIDTGKIWCQKKIKIQDFSKSNEVYNFAQKKIYQLFKNNYRRIFNKTIKSFKQNTTMEYFNKKQILDVDKINLNKKQKLLDFINHVRIRTWKNKSYCYFIYKNQKKSIRIIIDK